MKLLFKILLIITFIYVLVILKLDINFSKYNVNDKEIVGIIDYININGDSITLEVKGKDRILVKLYKYNNFEYQLGDKVKITGILNIPNKNTNFNMFNYRNYLKSKKIYYVMNASNIKLISKNKNFLYNIKNKIIKRIDKYKNKEYLKMFILGDTKELDKNIYNSYKKNGITHLFAISGMHISLLSGILLKLFKNYKLVILFLILYMFLARFTPSVMRATLLFILLYFNKNKKYNTLELLILILCFMLIYNPYYIYNTGFVFSFLISFNLVYFSKFLQNKNYIISTFLTSLISFISGLPIMIYNYFNINLLSIFLNMIFVPFISIIIFPFSLIVFIFKFLEPVYNFLIIILEKMSICFSKIICFNFSFANINIYLLFFYLALSFFTIKFIFNKKYKMVFIYILILFLNININFFKSDFKINVIDVGQGDSILIRINNNNVLIDTGGNRNYDLLNNILIPSFQSFGIKAINYLIITHGDFDHMGEAINLVNNFKVENVIFNCGEYNDLEQELIKVLDKKKIKYYSCIKELNIDKYKLEFLNTKEYDNENDNSNVIYFNYNDYKFLFMGDAGIEKEKDILDKYNLRNVDFLKIGHHGSNTSSSDLFINSINPKYSLISVGKNNRYGHPKDEVLETLKNSKIYRTDLDGSIEIKLNKNGYKIRTCPP